MRNIFSDKEQTNNLFNQDNNMATKQDIQDLSNQISAISAGLAFIGTRAEYEVAKMIPEGSEGHIPAKAMVIITDEDDTVKGDLK